MHTQCNYDANADWRCPETGKQRSPLLIYCSELLLATALMRACSLLGAPEAPSGPYLHAAQNYRCVLPK